MFGINTDKYNWQARESAPKNYPMQVVSGTLFYHGQDQGLYVPDRVLLYNGWGEGRSSHITGADTKPLPDRLEITFFSYTENQFYIGKFKLPYDKILAMFKAGYYSASQDKDITYNQIVVGIAPGGSVSVWLAAVGRTTEVFFGQAEKADVEWSRLTKATHLTREEFVRKNVQSSLKNPEAVAALRKNGIPFGLWRDTYRVRYAWQPVFTGLQLGEGGLIRIGRFYNGEQHFLTHPLNKTDAASTRAIPSELSFVGAPPGAKNKSVKLFFNEAEILDAFQKLGSNNQPLQLEMRNEVIDGQNRFSVWLRNDKDKIELKRTEIKTYNT